MVMNMPTKKQIAQAYRDQANRLASGEYSWVRGFPSQGNACAVYYTDSTGAHLIGHDTEAERTAMHHLGYKERYSVVCYNDSEARSVTDIIRLLRTIARIVEHGGKIPPKKPSKLSKLTEEQKTYRKRLLLLARKLDTEYVDAHFDYEVWAGTSFNGDHTLKCGTNACALGWATSIPSLRRDTGIGLRKADYAVYVVCNEVPKPEPASGIKVAESVFGLSELESLALFMPWDYALRTDTCGEPGSNWEWLGHKLTEGSRPSDIAEYIRRMVAHKTANGWAPMQLLDPAAAFGRSD